MAALACFFLFAGCSRFHHERHEIAYVSSARPIYIHDRVAPVSNRVCQVANGQALTVLERGRRFLKVRTDKNEIGWIEERATIDEKTYQLFVKLAVENKSAPVAATATLRDDLAMHLLPGRETERFYLIAGNSKVELLARASAPKKPAEVLGPLPPPAVAKSAARTQERSIGRARETGNREDAGCRGQRRDRTARDGRLVVGARAQGHVGWLLGSRLDVDVPDDVAQYAESQRIVGAWVLDQGARSGPGPAKTTRFPNT